MGGKDFADGDDEMTLNDMQPDFFLFELFRQKYLYQKSHSRLETLFPEFVEDFPQPGVVLSALLRWRR